MPACSTASAAMMPGPPALVMMATRSPLGSGCMAKAMRVVEQRLEGLGADHAGAAEGRAVGDVGAGQAAGVRRGGLDAGLGDARLEHDDRLATWPRAAFMKASPEAMLSR
jgi:hypothetical protein